MAVVREEIKKESRRDAKFFRDEILKRAKARCEACGFGFTPLLHIHHIVPVSEGGAGHPDNLIALCPNCHELVHKVGSNNFCDAPEFYGDWVRDYFENDEFVDLIICLSYGSVELVNGKWKAIIDEGGSS